MGDESKRKIVHLEVGVVFRMRAENKQEAETRKQTFL
jgi:hypothetical protein